MGGKINKQFGSSLFKVNFPTSFLVISQLGQLVSVNVRSKSLAGQNAVTLKPKIWSAPFNNCFPHHTHHSLGILQPWTFYFLPDALNTVQNISCFTLE